MIRWSLQLIVASVTLVPLNASGQIAFPMSPTVPPAELAPGRHVNEADNATLAHLERVRAFLQDKQWSEAVDTTLRVMESDDDMVIRLDDDENGEAFNRLVTVRDFCQIRLCEMATAAPEALALYRRRIDPLVERWFDDAIKRHDEARLQRIVNEMFASSWGDDALFHLGEFALESGDTARARECWERMHPTLRTSQALAEHAGTPVGWPLWLSLAGREDADWAQLAKLATVPTVALDWLVYPDTNLNLAEVRARLVLTSILSGETDRAAVELRLFRQLHAEATGHLAGRDGKLSDLLNELLEDSRGWQPIRADDNWLTLGGNVRRDILQSGIVDVGSQLWSRPLPLLTAFDEQTGADCTRVGEAADGLLSYHPVVSNGLVIVGDPHHLRVFRLADGKAAWPAGTDESEPAYGSIYRFERADFSFQLPGRAQVGVGRFTATVFCDWLFARVRSPITGFNRAMGVDRPEDHRGQIVGLDLSREGKMLDGFPLRPDDPQWEFEGSPVADRSQLYVAMRRRDNVRAEAHVACFDIQTGRRLWRTPIVTAETPGHGQWDELTHNLLTLDEGTIYYNTNLGAVGALRADTGRIRWIATYPRSPFRADDPDRGDRHFFRDLTPCLIRDGLVISAPADCDRLFALDAATGQRVWSTAPGQAADAVHLLGTVHGDLVCSGDYLYWIDLRSGRVSRQFPTPNRNVPGFSLPSVRGYGRGFISSGTVYWPTREELLVFPDSPPAVDTPPMLAQPINLIRRGATGGNVIMSGSTLLIAGPERLHALQLSR